MPRTSVRFLGTWGMGHRSPNSNRRHLTPTLIRKQIVDTRRHVADPETVITIVDVGPVHGHRLGDGNLAIPGVHP